MHQSIEVLGDDIFPACNAVKTLHTKEPLEAQKDEREKLETFLVS